MVYRLKLRLFTISLRLDINKKGKQSRHGHMAELHHCQDLLVNKVGNYIGICIFILKTRPMRRNGRYR
jgi:hypothetical protein